MTKTSQRLALVERQRRFEWQLARDAQTRAAATFVAGKTHDLLNLVQIVQLASLELARRCTPEGTEFVHDITKAASDAQRQLTQLMAVARPDEVITAGAPVAATLAGAVDTVRAASDTAVKLHSAIPPELTTRCTGDELEHLVFGLALDALPADDAPGAPIELFVRERIIDGKPWLEIVRGARPEPAGEHFDLLAVEAIAIKNGGELARSETRTGDTELVIALPVIAAKA